MHVHYHKLKDNTPNLLNKKKLFFKFKKLPINETDLEFFSSNNGGSEEDFDTKGASSYS